MVSQLSDTPKSFVEIAPVAGVSEITIKSAYKDLYEKKEILISPEGLKKAKFKLGLDDLPLS
jgi:hypothetical protein